MKDSKKLLLYGVAAALILSVIGISVGFASMSSQLRITGSSNMAPATWKIKFNNLSQANISGSAEVVSEPTIQSDTHIGNYGVKLTKPGDMVEYTFDIANNGNIDAEVTTYIFAEPVITGTGETALADAEIVKNNLVYSLTYADGTSVQKGDELAQSSKATLKLTVGYDADATELPVNAVSISNMDITFVYGQK